MVNQPPSPDERGLHRVADSVQVSRREEWLKVGICQYRTWRSGMTLPVPGDRGETPRPYTRRIGRPQGDELSRFVMPGSQGSKEAVNGSLHT